MVIYLDFNKASNSVLKALMNKIEMYGMVRIYVILLNMSNEITF